jgi:hypothetical protein
MARSEPVPAPDDCGDAEINDAQALLELWTHDA